MSKLVRTATCDVAIDNHASYLRLMAMCADVFNAHIAWSVTHNTLSKERAHNELYTALRQHYPELPSGLIQTTRDTALEAMKSWRLKKRDVDNENAHREKLNVKRASLTTATGRKRQKPLKPLKLKKVPALPKKRPTSSVRYDRRLITLRGSQVSFSTLGKRQKSILHLAACYHYFTANPNWKFTAAQLCKVNDGFVVRLIYTAPEPAALETDAALGIDLGLYSLATLSDDTSYGNAQRRASQRRYRHTRQTLQTKGTRSAKRRLKKLSGREKRFNLDVDHCVTKDIVSRDASVFVVEDLTHIRRYQKGKLFNKWLGSWSFAQFRALLEYKARAQGKRVVVVDARYTSQKCSRCGHISKKNRYTSQFRCRKCDVRLNADCNAALNILQNYLASMNESWTGRKNSAVRETSTGHMYSSSAQDPSARLRYKIPCLRGIS